MCFHRLSSYLHCTYKEVGEFHVTFMMMLPRMFLNKFLHFILSLRSAHDQVSRYPSWCWLEMFQSSRSSYPIHGWYGDWPCGKPHQKRHHINMWLTFGFFAAGMLFIKFCWNVSAGVSKGIEWHQRRGVTIVQLLVSHQILDEAMLRKVWAGNVKSGWNTVNRCK